MMRATLLCAALAVAVPSAAQTPPTLEQLLDRMGAYLIAYETQLSRIVADERFEQRTYATASSESRRESATLESDVAFIRLPGGAEWLGFRDVRKVNWKPVKEGSLSISEVLTDSGTDLTRALAISRASARHNLGLGRTINVPTAPLDIVHPLHRSAHTYEQRGTDTVRGSRTAVIDFVEVARPALVKDPGGLDLISSGRIWIEPATGTIWRIEWIYRPEAPIQTSATPRLRVDFAPHAELGMMVPVLMTEVFNAVGGRGEGRATYTNFRRFGTSARIVPQ